MKVGRQQDLPNKEMKEKTESHKSGCVSYNYSGPVTNNYYTMPQAPPHATPINDSASHGNSLDRDHPVASFVHTHCCHHTQVNDGGSCDKGCVRLHDFEVNDDGSHDLKPGKKLDSHSELELSRSKAVLSRKATFCVTHTSPAHHTPCLRSLSDSYVTSRQRCSRTLCCGHMTDTSHNDLISSQVAASPSSSPHNKEDELNLLAKRLFDVVPYSFIRRHYHGLGKEIIRSFFVIFFIYQAVSSGLMTICEEGGFRAVFHSREENNYPEITNRIIKFTLRILFRVILPLCCTIHLPIIATTPIIPRTKFSRAESVKGLMRIHNQFSSEEEVMLLRDRPDIVVVMSEEMVKRRIRSMWITITHSFLYIFLLLYLGAFYVCEQHTVSGGVCDFLSVTIIHVPFLNLNLHFIIVVESFTILINFIIFGVVGDCYNYENRIATYAVIIGGDAKKLFNEIRRRWVVMDRLVCAIPLVMAAILLFSISTKRPFISTPIQTVEASDLANWYFWIIVLTVLFFLGTSSNRMLKKSCIGGYIVAAVLLFTVLVETSHIPYGSLMVLLYTVISAYILNHLFCLGRCYYSNTDSCRNWLCFVTIVFLTLVLLVSLFVTIYREIALFSLFVVW